MRFFNEKKKIEFNYIFFNNKNEQEWYVVKAEIKLKKKQKTCKEIIQSFFLNRKSTEGREGFLKCYWTCKK